MSASTTQAPPIHLEVSASKTRCGLATWAPGINLGVLTVDPCRVTCQACQPRKYWESPKRADHETPEGDH